MNFLVVFMKFFIVLIASSFVLNAHGVECNSNDKVNYLSTLNNSGINIYRKPKLKSRRKVNGKLSSAMGKTHYMELDQTVVVKVSCINGDFAYVKVTEPDFLSETHHGWIQSKFLKKNVKKKIGDIVSDCRKWVSIKNGKSRKVPGFLYMKDGKQKFKTRVMVDVSKDHFFRCDYDRDTHQRILAEEIKKGIVVKKLD